MKLTTEEQYLAATILLSFLAANIRLMFSNNKEGKLKEAYVSLLCFLFSVVMDWLIIVVFKLNIYLAVSISVCMGLFLYYGAKLAVSEGENQSSLITFVMLFVKGFKAAYAEYQELKKGNTP